MIDLSPASQFKKLRKEDSEKFANMVADPVMRTALTYAMAQLTYSGVTTEELNGAKMFIRRFAELSEPAPDNQPIPAKELSE